MADECEKWYEYKYNAVKLQGDMYTRLFKYGDYALDPVYMREGDELSIDITLNFVSEEMAHDWSVVAYGENGPVSVTHNKGWTSDILPVIGPKLEDEERNDQRPRS